MVGVFIFLRNSIHEHASLFGNYRGAGDHVTQPDLDSHENARFIRKTL
jgi:hypothetical protein